MRASLSTKLGEHQLTATAALFDVNDTAGALLTFRGWALHDVKALAFQSQPLPALDEFMEYGQPRITHPIKEMDGAFLKPPGILRQARLAARRCRFGSRRSITTMVADPEVGRRRA